MPIITMELRINDGITFCAVDRSDLDGPVPPLGNCISLVQSDAPDTVAFDGSRLTSYNDRVFMLATFYNQHLNYTYSLITMRIAEDGALVDLETIFEGLPIVIESPQIAADSIGCLIWWNNTSVWRARSAATGGWTVDSTHTTGFYSVWGSILADYPWIALQNQTTRLGDGISHLFRWPVDSPLAHIEGDSAGYLFAPGDSVYRVNVRNVQLMHWHSDSFDTLAAWTVSPPGFIGSSLYLHSNRRSIHGWNDPYLVTLQLAGTTASYRTAFLPDGLGRPVWFHDTTWFNTNYRVYYKSLPPVADWADSIPVPYGGGYNIQNNRFMYRNGAWNDHTRWVADLDSDPADVRRYLIPLDSINFLCAQLDNCVAVLGCPAGEPMKLYAFHRDAMDSLTPAGEFSRPNLWRVFNSNGPLLLVQTWDWTYLVDVTDPYSLTVLDSLNGIAWVDARSDQYFLSPLDPTAPFPDSLRCYRYDADGFHLIRWIYPPLSGATPFLYDHEIYYRRDTLSADTTCTTLFLRVSPETGLVDADPLCITRPWFFRTSTAIQCVNRDTVIMDTGAWFVADSAGHWSLVGNTWSKTQAVGSEWAMGHPLNMGLAMWRRYPMSSVPERTSDTKSGGYQMLLSPNPTSGQVQIAAMVSTPGIYEVRVFDCLGNLVKSRSQYLSNGLTYLTEDLSELSQGSYIVVLAGNGKELSGIVVKGE